MQWSARASSIAASSFRLAEAMSKAKPFSAVLTSPHSVCTYWKFLDTAASSRRAAVAVAPFSWWLIPADIWLSTVSFAASAIAAVAR